MWNAGPSASLGDDNLFDGVHSQELSSRAKPRDLRSTRGPLLLGITTTKFVNHQAFRFGQCSRIKAKALFLGLNCPFKLRVLCRREHLFELRSRRVPSFDQILPTHQQRGSYLLLRQRFVSL